MKSYKRKGAIAKAFTIGEVLGKKIRYPKSQSNMWYYTREEKIRVPTDLSTVKQEFSANFQTGAALDTFQKEITKAYPQAQDMNMILNISVRGTFTRPTTADEKQALKDYDDKAAAERKRRTAQLKKEAAERKKREEAILNPPKMDLAEALRIIKKEGLTIISVEKKK